MSRSPQAASSSPTLVRRRSGTRRSPRPSGVLSPRRPGLQGGLAAARHCRALLRPQTPPPAPWRPGPPPGRRHGPPPAVGGRVRAASEGPVLAPRGPPRRELGRALLSYGRPAPPVLDDVRGHHPGGHVTLDHGGEAPGGPARGGQGCEVQRLSPGWRARRGSSRCWPVSGRPGAARSGPAGLTGEARPVPAGPCCPLCLARCPPRAGKPLLFSKCCLPVPSFDCPPRECEHQRSASCF